MVNKIPVLCLAFLIIGCSVPRSDNDQRTIEPYTRIDETKQSDQFQWLFDRTLKGLSSHEHYVVEAQFLDTTGVVRLHSHFNGFYWRDGVEVEFRRDGEHLYLAISTPQMTAQKTELPSNFLDDEGHFKVRVEVHNATSYGTRVLVWNYNLSLQGEVQHAKPYIAAANAEFDSHNAGWIFMSRGHGAKWGIETERAQILMAHREAPYAQ